MTFAHFRFVALAGLLAVLPLKGLAQGLQADVEEIKRLAGEVADLRDANAALLKRISQLQSRVDSLQESLRQANERSTAKMGEFVTRDDLAKMADKIHEVDQRREADRKLILEEFEKLGKSLSQPVEKSERPSRRRTREKDDAKPDKESGGDATPAKPFEGNVLKYKIQKGDVLELVVRDYNKQLKEDGRPSITVEQVKQANPGLDPNRLFAGREINLPVPDKKK